MQGRIQDFFRRGCTRLLFYFNTNKPHIFFSQNTSCIKKPQVILGGGGAYPLHPPPRSGPGTGTFGFGRGGDLFARRNYKKLHSVRVTDFCNRNTKALVFYEKGKTFTILTLNGTVLILEVVILKPCILYDHYWQSTRSSKIRNLSKTGHFSCGVVRKW